MDLWVFAYGSLMWRPNFPHEEAKPALLEGARRALCIYSMAHRGTPRAPGLVLGLDKGVRCQGIAFRVPKRLTQDTRLYLHRRENVRHTYIAVTEPVKLLDGSHRTVNALCFLADRRHPQYAGDLPIEVQAYLVRRSTGASGRNIDYVINTVEHLRELGVYDERLERLMTALGHGFVKRGNQAGPRRKSGHKTHGYLGLARSQASPSAAWPSGGKTG
ncbi:MAG TPA: gamma-glutamylcyclotransferase [Hyphomicrobiales bacterium]|nr:gamma-glutamylcyclotransferase [Hyphomicrobiales bacterium]